MMAGHISHLRDVHLAPIDRRVLLLALDDLAVSGRVGKARRPVLHCAFHRLRESLYRESRLRLRFSIEEVSLLREAAEWAVLNGADQLPTDGRYEGGFAQLRELVPELRRVESRGVSTHRSTAAGANARTDRARVAERGAR